MAGQEEMMGAHVAKKSYVLGIPHRFAYIRRYNVLKKLQETRENPLLRSIRLALYKLIGRKEEG